MSERRMVDSDKLETVENYIETQVDLTTYVKDLGFKMDGNTMSCPFHGSDSTPSLKINGHKWKCFGCGRGGGYLRFRLELALLENSNKTYYQVVEDFVRENADDFRDIGGSIYKTVEETLEDRWIRMEDIAHEKPRKPVMVSVQSYDIIIRKAKKCSKDIQMHVLAGIQSGMPYKYLENIINGTAITGMSLSDLTAGEL